MIKCSSAGKQLSAHSARPRKIPGWIVLVHEEFSVNKQVCRKQATERGFCVFYFSNFTFGFRGFDVKKLKIFELIFEQESGRKTIDCLCLRT